MTKKGKMSDCFKKNFQRKGSSVVSKLLLNPLGSVYKRSVPFGTAPKRVRLGLAFTWDPLEPFQMELQPVPKWVHLRSRSHLEPYPGRSHVNGWNGSKRERPGNDATIHCLST